MEILALLFVLAIAWGVFGAIFRKMGFSPLTGVLAIVPLINLIWWLYLATSEWPIERQLAEQREPDTWGQEDYITLMFRRAERCERYGDQPEALRLFEILADELDGQPGAGVARHTVQRLREKIDEA